MKFISYLVTLILCSNCLQAQDWAWRNPLPQGNPLYNIEFRNNEISIAVGGNGTIIKTSNLATEWKYQYDYPNALINSVCFVNKNNGFAVGGVMYGDWPMLNYDGLILKTIDGGNTWSETRSPEWNFFQDIQIINESIIYILGGNKELFKTNDGGDTWSIITFGTSDPFLAAIHFLDENIGFAVDGSGKVRITTDGGINWESWATPCTFMMNDVFLL